MGSPRGDIAFNTISLFAVTATLPSEVVTVSSGSLITKTVVSPTQERYQGDGVVRGVRLQYSPRFSSVPRYGTRSPAIGEDRRQGCTQIWRGCAGIYSDFLAAPFRGCSCAGSARQSWYGISRREPEGLTPIVHDNLEVLVVHRHQCGINGAKRSVNEPG